MTSCASGESCGHRRRQKRQRLLTQRRAGLQFDFDVRQRAGAAQQDFTTCTCFGRQRARLVGTGIDLAGQHRGTAHATAAGSTFERHGHLRAQARVQQRFASPHGHVVICRDGRPSATSVARRCGSAAAMAPAQQRSGTADHPPQVHRMAGGHPRIRSQIEPVDRQRGLDAREVGRALTDRRLDERQGEQHQHQSDASGRGGSVRARGTRCVWIHRRRQYCERDADVQKRQQRKEAIGDRFRQREVAHHGAAEHRQHVEPFGGRHHHVLRELVPRQHVAVDARRHRPARSGSRR